TDNRRRSRSRSLRRSPRPARPEGSLGGPPPAGVPRARPCPASACRLAQHGHQHRPDDGGNLLVARGGRVQTLALVELGDAAPPPTPQTAGRPAPPPRPQPLHDDLPHTPPRIPGRERGPHLHPATPPPRARRSAQLDDARKIAPDLRRGPMEPDGVVGSQGDE